MPRSYTSDDDTRLRYARSEYQELIDTMTARYTISSAFDHAGFDVSDYCRGFTPNPAAADAEEVVKAWAERYDLWIPGVTEHCNDLVSYLYPGANTDRLVTIGTTFAVDWYLNDTIGREQIASLSPEDQNRAGQLRDRLVRTAGTLTECPNATSVEQACLNMLTTVRSASQPAWFEGFLRLWNHNIRTMCQDGNARSRGTVATPAEYIQLRTHVSGMLFAIALSEFAQNQFLDWSVLRQHELVEPVERLQWHCAVIGYLSNDLFSFEKEFIRDNSDSNLVAIMILNDPDLTLHEAITAVVTRVRNDMIAFVELTRFLRVRCDDLSDPDLRGSLRTFIRSMEWCVQATWTWQTSSQRYRSPDSIFHETRTPHRHAPSGGRPRSPFNVGRDSTFSKGCRPLARLRAVNLLGWRRLPLSTRRRVVFGMTVGEIPARTSAFADMRERVDRELRRFLDGRATGFVADRRLADVFELTRDYLLGGGKRLRPLFCCAGWRGAGGDDTSAGIITAATSLELFHAFALIHDDIMDGSDMRRGRPALHRAMAELHRRSGWAGDGDEAGRSLGILAGDLCCSWSAEILRSCGLPWSRVRAAQEINHRMQAEVIRGQYLDLLGQGTCVSLAAAMEIVLLKTANYTVVRPLQIGGVLAGARSEVLDSYHELGVPLGEAFQLRDDLLGVFGDPAVTGKSTLDDLREGKATVLATLTREMATPAGRVRLDRLYGNPELDADGAAELREIMCRCGSQDAVEEMIAERVRRVGVALARAPITDDARALLGQLAETATTRSS